MKISLFERKQSMEMSETRTDLHSFSHDLELSAVEDTVLSPIIETDSAGNSPLIPLSQQEVSDASQFTSNRRQTKCNDVCFSLYFIFSSLGMIIEMSKDHDAKTSHMLSPPCYECTAKLRAISIINILYTMLWITTFQNISKSSFIKSLLVISAIGVTIFVISIYPLLHYAVPLVVFLFFTFAKNLFCLLRKRSEMEFSAALLDLTSIFLFEYPLLPILTWFILLFYTIWISRLNTLLFYIIDHYPFFGVVSIIFQYYWTTSVLNSILTVLISGATLHWYNKLDSSHMEEERTWQQRLREHYKIHLQELKRCFTISFGSICLAALATPAVSIISTLVKYMWIGSCPYNCLKLSSYRTYALTRMSWYGESLKEAYKNATSLIEENGLEAILENEVTSQFFIFGSIGYTALIGALSAYVFRESAHVLMLTCLVCVQTLSMLCIKTELCEAMHRALCMCYAENPDPLLRLNPIMYHRFVRLSEMKSFRDQTIASRDRQRLKSKDSDRVQHT